MLLKIFYIIIILKRQKKFCTIIILFSFTLFLHVATSSDLGLYIFANYKLHSIIKQKSSNMAIVKLSSVENGSSSTFYEYIKCSKQQENRFFI